MADLTQQWRALHERAGAVAADRDTVTADGPDAVTFLQGQLSQDIAPLAVGGAAWSLLLQPNGKVDAWLRVTRLAGETLRLDVDAGFGELVLQRLVRFKLRTHCELVLATEAFVAVRGPQAPDPAAVPGALPSGWPAAVGGFDLAGAGEGPGLPGDIVTVDGAVLERLRIEAGVPRMGLELTERTIPAEAGIVEQSVSFTKGCYTGQELVARIDSRGGNVPRRLRGIVVDDPAGPAPPPGAEVVVGGAVAGTVTSAAPPLGDEPGLALAYVGRAVEPPAAAELRWDAGASSAPARIVMLPMRG